MKLRSDPFFVLGDFGHGNAKYIIYATFCEAHGSRQSYRLALKGKLDRIIEVKLGA